MHPMSPVASKQKTPDVALSVGFDSSIQSLGALEGAAYRMIGTATCQIERANDRFICHLVAQTHPTRREQLTTDSLKTQFLNLVADENLRARVAEKTDGIRNVILALAFGSLVASEKEPY